MPAEAEVGIATGNLAKPTEAGASGGQAVKFGSFTVPTKALKLMPFGSSTIVGGGDPAGAGFRQKLWDKLTQQDKLTVNFVGSVSSGPTGFDRDHEGHGGWTIGTGSNSGTDLNAIVVNQLNTYKPDIMVFFAGTNDIITDKVDSATVTARLDAITAKIFTNSPDIRLIVGKIIIPQQSASITTTMQANARQFNDSMESVAVKYRNQGRYMRIVDAGGVVNSPSLYADDLHTNPAGYTLMTEVWYKGIRDTYPTF
jgi:lysophospholipase L1-like esterase